MSVLFEGGLFADYHQVVVEDVANADGAPEDYGEAAMQRRVTLTPHALTVFTMRNMTVPVRVELRAGRPTVDLAAWDHAVEASFAAPSGQIVVMGLTDEHSSAATAVVPAGSLRALVLSAGLASLSEDGLDGDDRYEIHLWPQPPAEVVVLKQWVEAAK